jgi:hypothetical protein
MNGVSVLYVRRANPLFRRNVENLWMSGAKAVDNRTSEFISSRDANDRARSALWMLPSRVASLDRAEALRKIVAAPTPSGIVYT